MPAIREPELEQLFLPIETVAHHDATIDDSSLGTGEAAALSAVSDLRRRQFAAGRRCAKAGLRVLGWQGDDLLPGDDGRPLWPTGFEGSISHTRGRAVAAVATLHQLGPSRVGVDIELADRVHVRLHRRLFTEDEQRWLARSADPVLWATATFSAKEAFYKAQFALTRSWVGFQDVEITWDALTGRGELHAHPGHTVACFADLEWPAFVGVHVDKPYVTTVAVVRGI